MHAENGRDPVRPRPRFIDHFVWGTHQPINRGRGRTGSLPKPYPDYLLKPHYCVQQFIEVYIETVIDV